MKLKNIIFLFVLGLLIFITGCYKNNNKIGIEMSDDFLGNFEFKKVLTHDSVAYDGEYESIIIRIKRLDNFSLEKSEQYISDKIFVIESLYREIHSPYPGALSNRIGCPDEFKPIRKENSPFDYYIIYASDRLTYGVCSRDLIKYKAILYFLYCDTSNSLYRIEFFVPLNEDISKYEDLIKSAKCIKLD